MNVHQCVERENEGRQEEEEEECVALPAACSRTTDGGKRAPAIRGDQVACVFVRAAATAFDGASSGSHGGTHRASEQRRPRWSSQHDAIQTRGRNKTRHKASRQNVGRGKRFG